MVLIAEGGVVGLIEGTQLAEPPQTKRVGVTIVRAKALLFTRRLAINKKVITTKNKPKLDEIFFMYCI